MVTIKLTDSDYDRIQFIVWQVATNKVTPVSELKCTKAELYDAWQRMVNNVKRI